MSSLVLLLVAQTSTLLPVDLPDTEKRVIVDFELGFNPMLGSLSGRSDPFGTIPGDTTYEDTSLFLDGTAALGTRGILWPTLNLYGLGSGLLDLRGLPGSPSLNPSIAYRYGDARALFLRLAYGELEGITEDGFLSDIHFRAGRQFHFSRIGLTFDGITLGYDGDNAKAAVRFGSRSSVFDRTQGDAGFLGGGFLVGGDLGWDFGAGFPLSIEAEVMHYRRTLQLFARDDLIEPTASTVEQQTTIGDLRIEYASESNVILWLAGEFTFPAISHVRAGASFSLSDVVFLIDFDQKIGRDLFYDLAGGEGLDRRERQTTYEIFRLNLIDPQPYSDLQLDVLIPLGSWLEIEPNAGFRFVEGDALESSPYDATRARYGLTTYGNFQIDNGNGLEATLGFEGLIYLRGDVADEGTFRDVISGSERMSHDVFAGLRYVNGGGFRGRRLLSDRTLSVGFQGFARFTRFENRVTEGPLNDRIFGAGADIAWQFTRYSGVRVAYEFARDSLLFYDYLGPFHSVRASLNASF